MAIPEITKLTFRHGTEADLNAVNQILADGEPVFCADGNILKIGDGVRRYSELPRLYNKKGFSVIDVFGIIDTGGRTADGATLAYIDENFNVIENMNPKQFEEHAAFQFTTETDSSGNEWVRVPKCYTKRGLAPSGQYSGNQYFMISPNEKDGFSMSPAFKDMGVDKDSFAVSAYRIANENGNPVSKPNMTDWTNITIGDAQTQAAKLGHLMDVYKWSHVAFLAAVEKCTFNVMPRSYRAIRERCEYRGIHDFCYGPIGSTYAEWLDGITINSSKNLMMWDINGNRTLTNTGKTQETAGYIKTLQTGGMFDHVFVPDQINADTSDCMIPDYFDFASAPYIAVMRFISSSVSYGAFNVSVSYSVAKKYSYLGFRAAKY